MSMMTVKDLEQVQTVFTDWELPITELWSPIFTEEETQI